MAVRRPSWLVAGALAAVAMTVAGCGGDRADRVSSATTVTVTQDVATPSSAAVTSTLATADVPAATASPTASPTTAAPFVDTADVAADPHLYRGDGAAGAAWYFQSPTGNVKCGIGFADASIRPGCQAISSVPSTTGTVCSNGGATAYAVTLFADHVSSHCANQPVYVGNSQDATTGTFGGRVLPYGQFIDAGGVVCRSTSYGITCTPESGAFGFVLARDRNTQFGRGVTPPAG